MTVNFPPSRPDPVWLIIVLRGLGYCIRRWCDLLLFHELLLNLTRSLKAQSGSDRTARVQRICFIHFHREEVVSAIMSSSGGIGLYLTLLLVFVCNASEGKWDFSGLYASMFLMSFAQKYVKHRLLQRF